MAKESCTSENFVASEGWLNRWKVRHEVRSLTICGEKMSADVKAAEKFKEDLDQSIEEDLTLTQIFNADETGLNYKMLPSKTLAGAKERQVSGFKQSKERVTVMVCSNADGSLKLPLVVIGKYANPRKLKNIPKNILPVYYTNQKSAWMDSNIFEKWFKEEFVPRVSAFLKEKKLPLKAILYLDNAPCHPSAETLSVNDIKVYYLPPNTTSLIQPMDQGIIENLKRRYRSQLLHNALNAQKEKIDIITFLKSISLKDVIYWISDAWIAVEPAMIKKCWKKLLSAKFFEHENEDNVTAEFNTIDLLSDIRQLNDYENINEDVIQDWIMNDDNCFTSIPSNNEIIQMVIEDSESGKLISKILKEKLGKVRIFEHLILYIIKSIQI